MPYRAPNRVAISAGANHRDCIMCGATWFAASIGFSGVCLTCAAAQPEAQFARGLSVWHSLARMMTSGEFEQSLRLYAHAILGRRANHGRVFSGECQTD